METCHCCSQQDEIGLESHYFTFFLRSRTLLGLFQVGNHGTGSKVAGLGLSLETDGVINSSSLRSSRSLLLCKYNFLCLPGSAKPGMIKEEEVDRKLKFYNYKKLCSFARKGVHSLYDNFYLEMLGAAYLQRRINIVDIVINLINENAP